MKPRQFFVSPGQRFGRLVVEEEFHQQMPKGRPARWAARCTCECGNEVTVLLQNLKEGTRSCGCLKKRGTMSEAFRISRGQRPRLFSVVPGQRFERLVVLAEFPQQRANGCTTWAARCKCDCGAEVTVLLNNLKSGSSRSCGCLQRARAVESNMQRTTHALSKHEHYSRWRNMLQRCEDPRDQRYERYGGRGIAVCPEWHDVAVFVEYLETTLGPLPEGCSLDRIDNDGDYEPGNIRWASTLTQRHNQQRVKP